MHTSETYGKDFRPDTGVMFILVQLRLAFAVKQAQQQLPV